MDAARAHPACSCDVGEGAMSYNGPTSYKRSYILQASTRCVGLRKLISNWGNRFNTSKASKDKALFIRSIELIILPTKDNVFETGGMVPRESASKPSMPKMPSQMLGMAQSRKAEFPGAGRPRPTVTRKMLGPMFEASHLPQSKRACTNDLNLSRPGLCGCHCGA